MGCNYIKAATILDLVDGMTLDEPHDRFVDQRAGLQGVVDPFALH